MAKYPPREGEIWILNNQRYFVRGIDSETKDVLVDRLDEKNQRTSAKPISEKLWVQRNYVQEHSKEESASVHGDTKQNMQEHTPKYTFSYNPDTNKFSVYKDGEFVTDVAIHTVSGAKGISAYEQWVNSLPKGTKDEDKSFDRFLKSIRGADGDKGEPGNNGMTWTPCITEDGLSLYFVNDKGEKSTSYRIKGEKGADGSQGPTGPKGEDADLWTPRISEDGNHLYFVNQKGESTERFPIKGPKGDAGNIGPRGYEGPAGPVFIPSVNSDGELSWSNTGTGLTNPETRNIKGDKGEKGDSGVTFHPVIKDGVLYWYDDKGLVENITPVRVTGPKGEDGKQGERGLSAYQTWLKYNPNGTEEEFLESLKGDPGVPAPPADFSYRDVEDYTCRIQKINTTFLVDGVGTAKSPEDIIDDRINEIKGLREQGHEPKNQEKYRVGWFKKAMWWCAGADRDLLTMCPGDHSKYVGIGTVILFTALMACFSSFIAMQLVFDPIPIKGVSCPIWAIIFALFWGSMIFCLDRFITNTMYSDGKVSISRKEFFSGLPRITIAIFLGIVISAPLELKIFEKEISIHIEENRKNTLDRQIKEDFVYATTSAEKERIKLSLTAETDKLNNIHFGDSVAYDEVVSRRGQARIDKITGDTLEGSMIPEKTGRKLNRVETQSEYQTRRDNQQSVVNTLKGQYDSISIQLESLNKSLTGEYKVKIDPGLSEKLGSLHKIPSQTAVWLIMILFILIDISPVLYKMMLADGKYDNYLHQEKLLAQDKIRLSLAQMLKKLDESELKRVAPFIMGDIYDKMAGDSYVFKTEEEFKKEIKSQEDTHPIWRLWPFSWLRWLFYKEKECPSAPVVVFEKETLLQQDIEKENKNIFADVVLMKKKLIIASYRRWYKTQHDCIICDNPNDENKGIEPFAEDDEIKPEENISQEMA